MGEKEKSKIACERQFVKEGRDRKRNRETGRNGDAVPMKSAGGQDNKRKEKIERKKRKKEK